MPRPGAFTLVELLVVIGIIVVLGALLFPVFEHTLKQSESAVCLSNLHTLAAAALLYSADYYDCLPPALVPASPQGYSTCWDLTLLPYVKSKETYVCRTDPNPTPGPSFVYSIPHSYGINLELTLVDGYQANSLQFGDVSDRQHTILFFDLGQSYSYGWWPSQGNLEQYVAARHHNGANFAFCGGNVKRMLPATTLEGEGMWSP
jgi:prepilin-type processing-associated H-X9-DG protein